jgi:DNA helicase-2/ATP-dependent DNA helicase PcrA
MDEPDQYYDSEGDRMMGQYQVMRARLTPRNEWPLEVASFAALWEHWKELTGYIDFTDMIENVMAEQIPPPGNPVVGFFDEVQDFTALELMLVRQWGMDLERIVLAGDDDQCLYAFKGASSDAFLKPPIPDEQKRVLAQSYRMPAMVHTYSQVWIGEIKEREDKFFRPRDEMGSIEMRDDLSYGSAEAVVREAQAYADETRRSVMILTACSYQLDPIVHELREQGVPFHNPYRRKRGDWNPLRNSAQGLTTAQRFLALLRPDKGTHGPDARPWTVEDVRQFSGLFPRTGFARRGAFKEVEGADAEQPFDRAFADRVLEDGVYDALLNDPVGYCHDHVTEARRKALTYVTKIATERGARRLMERPQVCVGTIHSVKGGEADRVYLMPDLSYAGATEWATPATADNVRRQFYVGMTRAKHDLVLCGPTGRYAIEWPHMD